MLEDRGRYVLLIFLMDRQLIQSLLRSVRGISILFQGV